MLLRPAGMAEILSLESDVKLPASYATSFKNLMVPLYPGMQTGLFVFEDGRMHHQASVTQKGVMLNKAPLLY